MLGSEYIYSGGGRDQNANRSGIGMELHIVKAITEIPGGNVSVERARRYASNYLRRSGISL